MKKKKEKEIAERALQSAIEGQFRNRVFVKVGITQQVHRSEMRLFVVGFGEASQQTREAFENTVERLWRGIGQIFFLNWNVELRTQVNNVCDTERRERIWHVCVYVVCE